MSYFNLDRRFVERESYDADELLASEVLGKRIDWSKVLNSRFCVVVAPANFGKTTEMQHRATQMRNASQTAVFIALRALADLGSVEKALSVTELQTYRAWKASSSGTLTLFVDSLDEAAAGKKENIEHLVRNLADAVSWPNERVNWVLSTRPAVLTPSVFAKLTEILVQPTSTVRTSSVVQPAVKAVDSISTSAAEMTAKPEKLRLLSMAPLERKQALMYIEGRYPNLDAIELLSLARDRGLAGFTKNPGGLDILASIDMLSNPPDSLTEVFTRVVGAIRVLRAADHRLVDAGHISGELLGQAAQRLASASQVCQLVNIEMPPAILDIPQKALSARLIMSPTLNEAAINQLLNSQLCIDVGFHQVKIYPDELLPFLAAQRLAELVHSTEQAWKLLQNFTWIAPSGEQGVQSEYLPLMGWLATMNPHCRTVILRYDPQALAFFGDLRNPSVLLADAEEALTESIRRLVEQGDHPGRAMFSLTSENHWQAGPQRLAPAIVSLFDEYGVHYAARELLLDITTASRSDILRTRVLRQSGGDYSRLLQDWAGVEYVLELGKQDDLIGLAAALISSNAMRDSLVALLLRRLGWGYFTPFQVSRLINQQFEGHKGASSISYLLDSGEFLEAGTDEQIYKLGRSLVLRVARLSDRKQRGTHSNGRSVGQYVEMAIDVVVALLSRTRASNVQRTARLCQVLQRALFEGCFSVDTNALRGALEANDPVRRALLGMVIRRAGMGDPQLLAAVVGYGTACQYQLEDIRQVNDSHLSSVYAEYLSRVETEVPRPRPTKRALGQNTFKVSSQAKKSLNAKLATLRNGSSKDELQWVAGWLLQTNQDSRYGEVDFDVFRRGAGNLIAEAVREGFRHLWREQLPLFDEQRPRSTYHITAAGLQGLHLELGYGEELPPLSEPEIRRALRYGTFEINGYPKWFWPLVAKHSDIAESELSSIAMEAVNGPVSKEHTEELFTSLSQAPQAIRETLAPLAWHYLINIGTFREYVEDQILRTVMAELAKVLSPEFERIALDKMKRAFKSPLPAEPDEGLTALRSNAVLWGSHWLTNYPVSFQKAVSKWGPKDPGAVKEFIFQMAALFGRDRQGSLSGLAQASDEGVMVLEHFYQWTVWAVNPESDRPRPDGVVYSPGDRDHAERFRNNLISIIASANSQRAYEVIGRILRSKSDDSDKMNLRRVQFLLRERQFARKPLPQTKYDQFEMDFRADVTDSLSFAMSVHSDLLALKYDIERGEHSLRSFFSEIDFKRVSQKGDEGDKAGKALEAHFQRLLASELNHHAHGRYSVSVESHTAESKRRDVLCSRNDWRASIELKMSERWSLEDYIVALERQLVGQYMRHSNATTGFLVVVLQTKSRMWPISKTGEKIGFEEVIAILSEKAQSLEGEDRSRYLRVIGIDATTPYDFRKDGKVPKTRKPSKPVRRPLKGDAGRAPKI